MKVQVLKTVGISVPEMKMQYCRKARKAVEMLVGKTVYLEPGIHDVTETQSVELIEAGLAVAVDAEPEVIEETPKKKGKGKKPEALDLGLD